MSISNLDALAEELSRRGDDAQRLDMVQRARKFKKTWVEMAEGLVVVERSKAFKRWGYKDIYAYGKEELHINKPTIQKLTMSYMTVRKYAPKVLERDGVEQPIPALDTVDYFAKALRENRRDEVTPADEGTVRELKSAVFEDVKPIQAIRKEFNPLMFPKPKEKKDAEVLERTSSTTRRLLHLLRNVDGLDAATRDSAIESLERLESALDKLLPEAKQRASKSAA